MEYLCWHFGPDINIPNVLCMPFFPSMCVWKLFRHYNQSYSTKTKSEPVFNRIGSHQSFHARNGHCDFFDFNLFCTLCHCPRPIVDGEKGNYLVCIQAKKKRMRFFQLINYLVCFFLLKLGFQLVQRSILYQTRNQYNLFVGS